MQSEYNNGPVFQNSQDKSKGKNIILAVMSVLVLGLAGLAFWQYSEAQSAKKDKSSVESQLTTLQNQIAESSKSSESKVADDTEVPAANQPTKSDDELLKETQGLYDKVKIDNKQYVVSVQKVQLPFARVSVDITGGAGASCTYKKSDTVWIQLYCGQGDNSYTEMQDSIYGVSTSIK